MWGALGITIHVGFTPDICTNKQTNKKQVSFYPCSIKNINDTKLQIYYKLQIIVIAPV